MIKKGNPAAICRAEKRMKTKGGVETLPTAAAGWLSVPVAPSLSGLGYKYPGLFRYTIFFQCWVLNSGSMCASALPLTCISEKDIIKAILLELGSKKEKTVQKVGGGREGRLEEGGREEGKEIQEEPLGGRAWLVLRLKTVLRDPLAQGRAVQVKRC